ncbi:lipid transfer protein EARLI 1-like [Punica granatum]|uniref:Bifunctional inhibitor/plant lipid transfer protein/seed storage helical domain-containing protein n=2 Tax=Punica granatum TaxID=22663 RepID=A0A218XNE9_PUNGR|nr:lipid transfer protein EARLI 1-like [Punica granatum]OWM86453.1 hypothetical protein CDL15_Pgr021540 [Punica granatum]PKI60925.1 hypothetical protein CRG98_018702 [Punica granatum]
MAAKSSATLAFFLSLNLLVFSLSSAATLPKPIPSPLVGSPSVDSPSGGTCPFGVQKLGACGNLLEGLTGVTSGIPPKEPCCSPIQGLIDLEAAVCICAAINANVLGIINLDVNVALTLLINVCGKNVPQGFQCA